jgi:hypothetical protein
MDWLGKKRRVDQDDWIEVGNCVTNRESFANLNSYFIDGPLEVIRIEDNTLAYTGGKFVFVKYAGAEQGFYLNAVIKVKCS